MNQVQVRGSYKYQVYGLWILFCIKIVTQDLCCYGILCSVDLEFDAHISGQPTRPIFKGQAVQEFH